MIWINLKRIAVAAAIISSPFILSACNLYKTPSGQETGVEETVTDQTESALVSGNVITYSDSGFSPSSIKVKTGDTVTFKNDSQSTVQVNSAPHPVHTSFPELNLGTIAPGNTQLVVTFTTAGTKKYHNHLNASQTGTIVVE